MSRKAGGRGSWLSFDNNWTGRPEFDGMTYEARWHYHAIAERICRDARWDGVLPITVALRCSDVDDPREALAELIDSGLLESDGEVVSLPHVDQHVPPPSARPEVTQPRGRKATASWRQRKCDGGEHDRHCPKDTCPVKASSAPSPTAPLTAVPHRTAPHRGNALPTASPTPEDPLPADDPWTEAERQEREAS